MLFLKALGLGATITVIAIGALIGGLHLRAPPAPTTAEIVPSGSEAQSRAEIVPPSLREIPPTQPRQSEVSRQFSGPNFSSEGAVQKTLARSIQKELRRVGCYDGPIDGSWSHGTREALESFTRALKISLPSIVPDHIILTAVESYGPTVCELRAPVAPIEYRDTGSGLSASDTTGVENGVRSSAQTFAPQPGVTSERDPQEPDRQAASTRLNASETLPAVPLVDAIRSSETTAAELPVAAPSAVQAKERRKSAASTAPARASSPFSHLQSNAP